MKMQVSVLFCVHTFFFLGREEGGAETSTCFIIHFDYGACLNTVAECIVYTDHVLISYKRTER